MSETLSNIESSTQEVAQKPTLKEALELALKDGKITSDEAKGLEQKFLNASGKISQEARQEWRQLSLELRRQFQKEIGTNADGAIGMGTIGKLKERAGNLNISSNVPQNPTGTVTEVKPQGRVAVGPPIKLTRESQQPTQQATSKESVDKTPSGTSIIKEDDLFDGLTGYMDFEKSEKFSIDLNNPVFPEGVDKNKIAEAKRLIEISKGIDGIDDGRISFTKDGKVVLELNTRGSDLYIQFKGNNLLVSGQSEGKFFVSEVSEKDFNKFVKDYDSENTKQILEELGFTTGFTIIGVMCFLLRTGIGMFIPVAGSAALAAYRGYNLYKLYNLSTNATVEIGEKLKDKPDVLKKYLFLTQVGYIIGTGADGTYKTRDGGTIKESDFEAKYSQIKNNLPEERKYLLLSQLETRGYSPEFKKGENRYEIDFHGFFDDSSIKFDGNKALITTSQIKGKTFEVNLADGKAFETISMIDEYIKINFDIMNLQSNNGGDRYMEPDELKQKELIKRKSEIAKTLGISNV